MATDKDSLPQMNASDDIRTRIYTIRGVQVMLDSDLAEIYGYETKNFNRQVKNNMAKFDEENFMFRLTREEFEPKLRCKICTSSWGGQRHLMHLRSKESIC